MQISEPPGKWRLDTQFLPSLDFCVVNGSASNEKRLIIRAEQSL